jgi:hypothetical protein
MVAETKLLLASGLRRGIARRCVHFDVFTVEKTTLARRTS